MYRFTSFINSKDGWKLERLAAFCDGVIAIVITLLVLGIEVPSVHSVTQEELGDYLLATLPSIIGYVVSFVMIGMYWCSTIQPDQRRSPCNAALRQRQHRTNTARSTPEA